ARKGEFATVEAGGERLTALTPARLDAGAAVRIAVRPENVRLGQDGVRGTDNRFTARVAARRYQGTQTIYELAALGGRIEALELGTQARHAIGSDVDVVLPAALCWAYPAGEGPTVEEATSWTRCRFGMEAAVLARSASMRDRIGMYNANALKIGVFGANCSSGRSATTVPERWSASWPDCRRLARLADDAGIDFMLPIGRWK